MKIENADEGLVRVIGPVGLTASILNVVIGSGVFVLPATVASTLGSAAPAAYLVSGLAMGLVTVAFAQAGSRVARSGGPYGFAEAALGPFAGFVAGVLLWLGNVLASAGIAAALTDSLATAVPPLNSPLVRGASLAALYGALALVNVRGARAGTGFVAAATVAKLTALLIFILVGMAFVSPENLRWTDSPTSAELGRASLLIVFALSGMEIALGASGEVRDPKQTIPRALCAALTVAVLLYVCIQVVAQGVLGAQLGASGAPLADALGRTGAFGGRLMLLGGAASMLGWLAGDVLGSSRVLFAFGRAGLLPRRLARVHPDTRVPHVAIATHAVIACALAVSGTFAALIALSSVAVILLYLVSCAAAFVLLGRPVQDEAGGFRGGGPVIPVLASIFLVWVLSHATARELLSVAIALILASAFYGLSRVDIRQSPRA